MNPEVDAYIERSDAWPAEMRALRPVLLDCGLDEALKWGKPCYSYDGANITIMQEMKSFLALMLFRGALLEDPLEVLRSQGPNSRSALRFELASAAEVTGMADTIRDYVEEAIEVEKAGLEVGPAPEPEWAEELQARLDDEPDLRKAFEGLTPGRRREYNLYFSDAKQSKTRQARIERYAAKILDGKGLRDR